MSNFNGRQSLTNVHWHSPEPLTKSDIERMRQEFWDTASAYEGYKETWDLLRKCVDHVHKGESELAEDLLVMNGIIIPEGILSECYNELGYKFEIPNYVLSYPTNIQTEDYFNRLEQNKASGLFYSSVNVRLSDARMFTVSVGPDDTIGVLKSKLEGPCNVPSVDQRWYFGGKLLRNDVPIRKYSIDNSHMIQAIIHKPKKPDNLN